MKHIPTILSAIAIALSVSSVAVASIYKGPEGDAGVAGAPGEKGPTGDKGPQGPAGDKGPQGDKGPDGAKGETGLDGLVGNKGETGLPGEKGEPGLPGEKGPNGPKGPQGDAGEAGTQGQKGDTGLKGDAGEKGDTGPVGDKGPKGENGPQGQVGPTGDAGPKGNRGEVGSIGPKGDTGLPGEQGPQGDTGPVGETGNVGPKGETGQAGNKGQAGEKGPAGDNGLSAYELYIQKYPQDIVIYPDETTFLAAIASGKSSKFNAHTVTFNSGEGASTVESKKVIHGEKVSKPENPTKVGYTFEGWACEGELWAFTGFTVTQDITLEAIWSVQQFSVTFNLDNGTDPVTTKYDFNSVINHEDPVKDLFVFNNWTDETGAVVTFPYTLEAKDKVFTANYMN